MERSPRLLGGMLVVSVAVGVSLGGCSAPAGNPQKVTSTTRMGIADIAEAGGDPDSARVILAAAMATDPDNGELQVRYASALLQSGRPEEAIGPAQQAVEHHPDDMALALRAARVELRAGDAPLAAATFEHVLARGDSVAAWNGLGVCRVQLHDMPGAEDAFRRAVALSPGDYASRNNLALAFVLQGRAADAVPLLQSLADEPGIPGRVKHNLALAYAQQGDTAAAADVLTNLVGASAATREAAGFAALRTQAPTQIAGSLAPAELIQGRVSGAAYAGTLPPRTANALASAAPPAAMPAPATHLAAVQAMALPAQPKPAPVRPAPVAPVQIAAIATPTATPVAAPKPAPAHVVAVAEPVPATPPVTLAPPAAPVVSAAPMAQAAVTAVPTTAAPIAEAASTTAASTTGASTSAGSDKDPLAPALLAARVFEGASPVAMPSAATPAMASSPVAPAPVPVVQTAAAPGGAALPAPGPAAQTVSATMAVTEPSADGDIKVHIAAVPTRLSALALWKNLTDVAPDLLTGRTPVVKRTGFGRVSWTLGTGGFHDVAAAEQFCQQLRDRGPNCAVGL